MMSYNYELNEWKRFEYWDENVCHLFKYTHIHSHVHFHYFIIVSEYSIISMYISSLSFQKRYTRNLIASDDKHFTLMLLCWNCNKASPIHNHNGSECFLRVLQGDVIEYKYCVDYTNSTNNTNHTNHNNTISQGSSTSNCSHSSTHTTSSPSPTSLVDLQLLSQEVYNTGQCTFINDSIGVHKIETDGNKAVSLHCYIPGYMKCKSYVEELHCMKECHISFDTEHGEIISAHQC